MRVVIIDNETKEIDKLVELVKVTFCLPVRIINLKDFIYPKHIDVSDIIVLSGGGGYDSIVSNEDYYKNIINVAKNHTGPIIGICLGAQAIGYAYGCQLKKFDEPIIGDTDINQQLTTTLPDVVTVYEKHQWGIVSTSDAIGVFGTSNNCIEIIKHAHKPIYGLQFHPEVKDGNSGYKIFQFIVSQIIST